MSIFGFFGKYRFLSNFYACNIEFVMPNNEVYTFPSAEHLYQALKNDNPAYWKLISKQSSPGKAKQLGSRAIVSKSFNDKKIQIMYETVLAKFTQNSDLADKLVATGNELLFEANDWGDKFWGVDSLSGEGFNLLGQQLMKVRKQLR